MGHNSAWVFGWLVCPASLLRLDERCNNNDSIYDFWLYEFIYLIHALIYFTYKVKFSQYLKLYNLDQFELSSGTDVESIICVNGTESLINYVLLCALCIPAVRHSTYRTVFRQLHAPAVDLVSDPLTQPPTSSRGAEPSSASAVSIMRDPLLGTVFRTTFTSPKNWIISQSISLLVLLALLDAS